MSIDVDNIVFSIDAKLMVNSLSLLFLYLAREVPV